MRKSYRKHLHIIFSRIVYTLLFVTIQALMLIFVFVYAESSIPYFYLACLLLSLIVAAHIILKNNNPAYKIAWLMPIAFLPIFGGLLYLMFGSGRVNRSLRSVSSDIRAGYQIGSPHPQTLPAARDAADQDAHLLSNYIVGASGCQPYEHTKTVYFSSGEEAFPKIAELLSSAKRYIFLEFFIIAEGEFWDTVLEILTKKAEEGVDVRVLFDDFGCMLTLPRHYEAELHKRGIQAMVFNPFNTILSPRPNNRDHRKICVVDGIAGFTGGINLADEYINVKKRCGYWKDAAILLYGDAVWGMTIQFLSVWNHLTRDTSEIARYYPDQSRTAGFPKSNGIVQPYTDIPMDDEQVGEAVYFQMITRARKYVYIMTPYLILDYEMTVALQTAAKSGVDVRIMTPHIPDKKIVFFLTRSYYKPLIDAGVRIYEFEPGFVHSKCMVSDDRFAVVGSINLDYRSLYLHLENAVWLWDADAIPSIRDDFLKTQEVCISMTADKLGRLTLLKRLWLSILRTFAPLM